LETLETLRKASEANAANEANQPSQTELCLRTTSIKAISSSGCIRLHTRKSWMTNWQQHGKMMD
jgi:hypothetical protein